MVKGQLVSEFLEHASWKMFDEYAGILKKYTRYRPGVYALYKGTTLYYVGLAKNLGSRVEQHLKNQHEGKWDNFSIYMTIGDSHIRAIEGLVLRMANPKGNNQTSSLKPARDLRKIISKEMREYNAKKSKAIFGAPTIDVNEKGKQGLASYGVKVIRAKYGGKFYRARVRNDGHIVYAGKAYRSPSAAGAAVVKHACAGWNFWMYERAPGDWISIDNLRR